VSRRSDQLTGELAALGGRELCRVRSDLFDVWLGDLFADSGADRGVAVVAVGGYGRREMSLGSDLDVLLLHGGVSGIGDVANRIWYPLWDEGLKVGHAVRTMKEALSLADADLDTATSLLQARHVAGDERLSGELADRALGQWRKRSSRWLARLADSVEERHRKAGEVAFLLEPDLKEGRGGLRDVHALSWAEAARRVLLEGDDEALAEAYDVLLAVRVELHRRTGKAGDRLLLEDQDAVAAALGEADADVLMARVSGAARTIAWTSDEAWDRIRSSLRGPIGRLPRRDRVLGPGIVLRDGEVHVETAARPDEDPTLVLRAAAAAAANKTRITRSSLDRLTSEAPGMPEPWPVEARAALVQTLGEGDDGVVVMEALDQRGLLVRVLPEWAAVRTKPQRNAYHRFTVDRHLCEAAAQAARLVDRVDRPDLLLIGAWLHDIGKGFPGDHTHVGMDVIARVGRRLGFPDEDVAVLVEMVRHHLLLPDAATRRDISDEGTIIAVAEQVGSVQTLHLLAALTEADSIATGPSAWGGWKAGLLEDLVGRVRAHLEGREAGVASFPSPEHEALMAAGEVVVDGHGDQLTVVAPDRPGLLSRVAGAISLSGLDVLAVDAHSSDDGMAVEVFKVASPHGHAPEWERITNGVRRALAGRLALDARIGERARDSFITRPRIKAATPAVPSVHVDNDTSATATVIEVRAPDAVGLLYRVTRALAELDLDIRHAKVQTLGHEVVDSFYVRDALGEKVTDPDHLRELERALLAVLSEG
jgi:[protein-PII] uridylyltransferase